MPKTNFQYDETGNTFYYFFLTFLGFILIPSTYYFWPQVCTVTLYILSNDFQPIIAQGEKESLSHLHLNSPKPNYKGFLVMVSSGLILHITNLKWKFHPDVTILRRMPLLICVDLATSSNVFFSLKSLI